MTGATIAHLLRGKNKIALGDFAGNRLNTFLSKGKPHA
jgi:hypothetical protein